MRPLPGDEAPGRLRADSDGPSTFSLPPAPQMTYFLTDESSIGSSSQPPLMLPHRAKEARRAPAPESPEQHQHHRSRAPLQPAHHDPERDRDPGGRTPSSKWPIDALKLDDDSPSQPLSPLPRSSDTPDLSRPLTPILLGTSGPASALSSMSSRRNSLCLSEDLDSRPPSAQDGDAGQRGRELRLGEGEREGGPGPSGASLMDSGCAPQLIMPSIEMPSRRPFTDEGKRMGRLKVLVAGDSGVGKTSLIKAIVQSCEHIVHVDPIAPSSLLSSSVAGPGPSIPAASGGRQRGSRRQRSRERAGTTQISEVYASTKPYPEWWSEVDDLRILRRRKSLGDAVLDRNICFVDTPGYGSGSSAMDAIAPVVQYIEDHLQRLSSNSLSDGDLLNLLGGEGGIQVDAVFYMVSNRLRPVDIHYLRQVAPLTNIIILLAQADLMSAEQVAASKEQIYGQLNEAGIRLFSFSMPSPNHPASSDPDKQGIYAISSATGSDHDIMDASLLMSPDYVQPLIPTELATLVEHVFTSNGVARLRHSAARKYVQWRKAAADLDGDDRGPSRPPFFSQRTLTPNPPTTPLTNHHRRRGRQQSSPVTSRVLTPPMGATSSYALARLADHTQREERLAQVRLANWAADLQRSLAREREQYAALARADRAVWLAERIGECLREQDTSLVPATAATGAAGGGNGDGGGGYRDGVFQETATAAAAAAAAAVTVAAGEEEAQRPLRRGKQKQRQWASKQRQRQQQRHQDPLGLLEVADELRYKGLIALEVIGGLGVLGGLALWVTRHYLHLQAYGWLVGEWERVWYGR